METRRVVASDSIKWDAGRVALQRGPLMYCAEWIDNNGRTSNLIIPSDAAFTSTYKPDLLNGIVLLQGTVPAVKVDQNGENISTQKQPFTAIPYYAWANRGKGEMQLWFPEKVQNVELISGR